MFYKNSARKESCVTSSRRPANDRSDTSLQRLQPQVSPEYLNTSAIVDL